MSVSKHPEGPRFEAMVCEDHAEQMDKGEPWVWSDEDDRLLMGEDLDSGGQLIIDNWRFVEEISRSWLELECHRPSGAPHEPVRFTLSRDDLETLLGSFRMLFPDVIRG